MAVNIFEELVRAALNAQGYLTFENASYSLNSNARSLQDSDQLPPNPSDIDLIAIHPRKHGFDHVLAVNCKGGKEPLNVERDIQRIINGSNQYVAGGPAKTGFRELHDPDWAKAFRRCIGEVIGAKATFTHITVVRSIEGNRVLWRENDVFKQNLKNPVDLWDFNDIIRFISRTERLNTNSNALKLVELFHRAA